MLTSSPRVRLVPFRVPQRELVKGGMPVVQFDGSGTNVTMNGSRKAAFTFDRVFVPGATQEEVGRTPIDTLLTIIRPRY